MYFCETMARLTCHASLLKVDDIRLKSQSRTAKMCSHCDLAAIEDVYHLILQCPRLAEERANMFTEIDQVVENFNTVVANDGVNIVAILLGKALTSVPCDKMVQVWKISGYHIHKMYKLIIQRNDGVG